MIRKILSRSIEGLSLLVLLLHSVTLSADAIIRSQAMFATTVAEIYIEKQQVRVELEIGGQDLKVFANLLPDAIYEEMTGKSRPYSERLKEFFSRQLVLTVEDSERLHGGLTKIGPSKRQQRDPVTGEVLAADEEEAVVRATLVYPVSGNPEFMAIQQTLAGSSIGFVAYHGAVPLNDFRYLSPVQVVDLDWEDPWYSTFRSRALRRTYSHPMSGFLYVEPYEVRKEIIVRPKDLQFWIDLGLTDKEFIPVENQAEIKQEIQEFFENRLPVKIDGKSVEGELVRINFLERTLNSSRVIDPPESLDLDAAILGLIYVFPIDSLPQNVTMEWDLFNDRIQMISAASVDQAGPLPTTLEPDFNVLEWNNFLKNPKIPALVNAGEVPRGWALWLRKWRWLIIIGVGAVAFGFLVKARPKDQPVLAVSAVIAAFSIIAVVYWLGQGSKQSAEETSQVVSKLLQNIYHAFDYRKEGKIYDVLSYSVDGDLLTTIYLETQKGLVLANQGGARTKVKEIVVTDVDSTDVGEGKISADATWEVTGSVGHWGHVHTRKNQYSANLLLTPDSGNWKIEKLEILKEHRVN